MSCPLLGRKKWDVVNILTFTALLFLAFFPASPFLFSPYSLRLTLEWKRRLCEFNILIFSSVFGSCFCLLISYLRLSHTYLILLGYCLSADKYLFIEWEFFFFFPHPSLFSRTNKLAMFLIRAVVLIIHVLVDVEYFLILFLVSLP